MEKTRITAFHLFKNSIENFKKASFRNAAAVALVATTTLSGCGPTNNGDKEAPVISNVDVTSETITVTASDSVGVTGYIVTTSPNKPAANDPLWNTSSIINVEEAGTYFVWVKDDADNISTFYQVAVVLQSTLERLAKNYDHLAWVIAPDTAETKALKEQYGDLYPMVEPLTEQQIKDRWVYLVNYLVEEKTIANDAYSGGLSQSSLGETFYSKILEFRESYKKELMNSNDSLLSKYNERYYYADSLSIYGINLPESLTSRETRQHVGLDIIDKVPIEDMEWFVRDYMMEAYKTINMAKDSNAEMNFYFDNQAEKTK